MKLVRRLRRCKMVQYSTFFFHWSVYTCTYMYMMLLLDMVYRYMYMSQ